jgi:hypothetical protein
VSATSTPAAEEWTSARASGTLEGFGLIRIGAGVGVLGQLLVWGSVLILATLGTLYSNIPLSTTIVYGATTYTIAAQAILALNCVLVAGIVLALVSSAYYLAGFGKVGAATPFRDLGAVRALTSLGITGFGMFAVGWCLWLGSLVPPGPGAYSAAYASQLSANLSGLIDVLLVAGGFFAFVGGAAMATGAAKIGEKYEEASIETGALFTAIPVLSVVGQSLCFLGIVKGERKITTGWAPPPPPPPPPPLPYPPIGYAYGYPGWVQAQSPRDQEGPDALIVLLVVLLVVFWFFVPAALLTSNTTKGPGGTPGGGGASAGSSASSPSGFSLALLVAILATAVIVPLAVVRTRRRRMKARPSTTSSASSPLPAPTPPPPPPPRTT